jgi:hypothetical protein
MGFFSLSGLGIFSSSLFGVCNCAITKKFTTVMGHPSYMHKTTCISCHDGCGAVFLGRRSCVCGISGGI